MKVLICYIIDASCDFKVATIENIDKEIVENIIKSFARNVAAFDITLSVGIVNSKDVCYIEILEECSE